MVQAMKQFSLELFANAFTLVEAQESFVHIVMGHPQSLKAMVAIISAIQKDAVKHRTVWDALIVENESMRRGVLHLRSSIYSRPKVASLAVPGPVIEASLQQLTKLPVRLDEHPGSHWTLKVDFN